MSFAGKFSRIYIPSESSKVFTTEATTVDETGLVYKIADATKRIWDPQEPILVEGMNGEIPASEYSVCYAGGYIRFRETREPSDIIVVSGKYFDSVALVSQGRSWEYVIEKDTVETTVFEDDGWKKFKSVLKGGSVSIERFLPDIFFLEALDRPLYLILFVKYDIEDKEDSVPRIECIAELTSDSLNNALTGVVEESTEFTVTGEPNLVFE